MKTINAFHFSLLIFLLGCTTPEKKNQNTIDQQKIIGKGVARHAVIHLRKEPRHPSELVTQVLMGTPLDIISQDRWVKVQTPEGYTGWCDSGAVEILDDTEYAKWKNTPKLIVTQKYCEALQDTLRQTPLCDLVAGNIVNVIQETNTYFQIQLADSRRGYIVKKAAQNIQSWLATRQFSPEELIQYTQEHLGIAYLWGGTSFKGVDCSGLIKNAAYMCGIILPRDASQMAEVGERIETNLSLENIQRGDLLFFGKSDPDTDKPKVTHVGLYLGNKEFIHASGHVKINSFDSLANHYDRYNHYRLLWCSRLYNSTHTTGIKPIDYTYFQ